MKKNSKITYSILIFVIIIFAAILFLAGRAPLPSAEIIASNGIHWHTKLEIKILGESQEFPVSIGLGITHNPIHTHDSTGIIHMEFPSVVRKNDILLGRFFEIWGKKFNKDCIFDKCSGPDGQLKMFVNGKENSEFENYIMRDGDTVEIIFE